MKKVKKNPRAGQGMKARGDGVTALLTDRKVSTIEGQQRGPKRGVGRPKNNPSNEGRLEASSGADNSLAMSMMEDENTVQNLDSEESLNPLAVASKHALHMQRAAQRLNECSSQFAVAKAKIRLEIAMGRTGDIAPNFDAIVKSKLSRVGCNEQPIKAVETRITKQAMPHPLDPLGHRQDGTFGIILSLPEGYIEPIRQQAESDKIAVEEWCRQRFLEYIESWWSAPQGR